MKDCVRESILLPFYLKDIRTVPRGGIQRLVKHRFPGLIFREGWRSVIWDPPPGDAGPGGPLTHISRNSAVNPKTPG